jgi:YD repeat-containing protein
MNKWIRYSLCLLWLFVILGKLSAQEGRLSKEVILKQGIKSVTTEYYQVSSQRGLMKVKAEKFGYDQRGNLVERMEYDRNGEPETSTRIRYDEHDQQIYQQLIQHDQNRTLEVSWLNTYEDGKIVEVKNSNTPAVKTFAYDQQGRIISQTDTDANGKVFGLKTFEYDEKGNIVKQKDVINFLERTFVHQYNQSNQKTRTVLTKENKFEGGEKTVAMEDYSYNAKGKLAKTVFRDNSGSIQAFSQFYYDKSGKLIKEEKGETHFLYKYDDRGNLIEKKKTIKGKVQLVEKIIYAF